MLTESNVFLLFIAQSHWSPSLLVEIGKTFFCLISEPSMLPATHACFHISNLFLWVAQMEMGVGGQNPCAGLSGYILRREHSEHFGQSSWPTPLRHAGLFHCLFHYHCHNFVAAGGLIQTVSHLVLSHTRCFEIDLYYTVNC